MSSCVRCSCRHSSPDPRVPTTGRHPKTESTAPVPARDHVRMTTDLIIRGVRIPAAELSWRFSRSSGPGGQGVNTTDSRAEVSFDLAGTTALPDVLRARALRNLEGRLVDGVLTVASSEQRSQLMNRQTAARRLADLLVEAT